MVELVVVVALIALMAAVGLPNLLGYLKLAKVRGATNEVAGEIQIARNRAIKRNVNPSATGGVVFAVLDQDSYRFSVLDDNDWTPPQDLRPGLAPLRDLPQGLVFVAATRRPRFGIGFDSLGRLCDLGATAPACAPAEAVTRTYMCTDNNSDCNDKPVGSYITGPAAPSDPDFASWGNTFQVRIREVSTGVERTVAIHLGGKVQAQR